MSKVCGSCKQEKPLADFNRKGAAYQNKCRPCQKEWYQRYYQESPKEKDRLTKRTAAIQQENRKSLKELKESKPCMDCGNYFPYYVMDFDHQRDKRFQIANMLSFSWSLIEKEIEKCELVCANCHRIRTHSTISG